MSSAERPFLDKTHPEIYKALTGVTRHVRRAERAAGLSRAVAELVNVRVSQINGCPACLSVHVPAARRAGVSELKLDLLPSWQDAEAYTEEERIALELAEALTIGRGTTGAISGPELVDVQQRAQHALGEEKLAVLEWSIVTINAFNRVSIASGHPPHEANYS